MLVLSAGGGKLSSEAPNYAKEFFRTGYTTNNSISLAGGNENITSYFSYANVSSNGVIPENTYMSHNLLAKVGFNLWTKLHVDVSARYNTQHIENQPASGYLHNPLTGASCSREARIGTITKTTTKYLTKLSKSIFTTGQIQFRNNSPTLIGL